MLLFSVQELSLCVQNRALFSSLSFNLSSGEIVGLGGATGTGKTQLYRILARLRQADSGRLILQGQPLSGFLPEQWRAQVMYLPQDVQLRDGNVLACLRRPFGWRVHRGKTWSRQKAAGLLLRLGQNEAFLEKATADLSGGERQIVALVRALLLDPLILLADEATAALDEGTFSLVSNLLAQWVTGVDRAILFTSHSREQRNMAQRTLELSGA